MHIPPAYLATLAHVRGTFPDTLIAGGCLRDADNKRPVKDVDLFAPNVANFDHAKSLVDRLVSTTPNAELIGVMGGYESWATTECIGVFDIRSPELDYQLICLNTDQASILPRMDFGLCRIAFDGDWVIKTDEYLRDQQDQKFTLIRCEDSTQFDRSISRFERFTEKYAGWQFDLTPELKANGWPNPFSSPVDLPGSWADI